MSSIPSVINSPEWIQKNEHLLQPPVNNKDAFTPMNDFIIRIVGGPNNRTDFHCDPYEEWLYQYRSNMRVNIQTPEGLKRIDIREGEMWLPPGNVFHSPQRPEDGSIGVVIERIREEGQTCPERGTVHPGKG